MYTSQDIQLVFALVVSKSEVKSETAIETVARVIDARTCSTSNGTNVEIARVLGYLMGESEHEG